jgi:basic membrane lipoprotein Med (substrate-binding protein (PBP1-ABC) superfamily)
VVVGELEIIPGYPNPNNGKIYRLQVGSFSSPEAAAKVAQLVKDAGFDVAQELSDYNYRVLVTGIPASAVYPAMQRLGAIGIGQIWVRE